jgi:hypothetical protein
MCILCKYENLGEPLPSGLEVEELDCSNCHTLTQIPLIHGLKKLKCSNCPQLTQIPQINGLKKLDCSECPLLTKIPLIFGLRLLLCSNCPLLTKIPHIDRLKFLSCNRCPLLTQIPLIYGLRALLCSGCPLLTNIPHIDGLQSLWCSDCRSLTELKVPNTVINLYHVGNVWLDTDHKFKESLEKLIYLQRWVRKRRLRIKLKKLIPMIIPIYYHPDSRGGYFDKKQMLQFLEGL